MAELNLAEGNVSKHIKTIAIPASIGFLFNTLFNVVDTLFAGQIDTSAIAGMAIGFPIFFLLISISMGLGNSATALNAIAIGKHDKKLLHSYLKNAVIIGIIIGIFIPVISQFFLRSLFALTGATGDVLQVGLDYTFTILIGTIFFVMNYILNAFLNAQGNTKPFRNFLIIGFFMNIILDPMFVLGFLFIPKLGVIGIALATVIVQATGTFYLFHHVRKSEIFDKELYQEASLNKTIVKELFSQAIPSTLSTASIAIGVFIINYFVLLYGGDNTVAAYGIGTRIVQIALIPTLGINIAILSIIGQSFGANKLDRISDARNKGTIIGLLIILLAVILIFPFAGFFVSLFDDSVSVINAGRIYLRFEAVALFTYIFININVSVLQGIKQPRFTIFIGLYRQLFPFIIFGFLGTTLGLGIYGVWWGIVLINWSAVIIIYIYTSNKLKQIKKEH